MNTAEINFTDNKSITNTLAVYRITALWGFSEAALGGILHAFKIPFTGLFIGGSAVLFITLIAYFSQEKSTILKSTLIVLLVKAAVSPHTPLTAYFAVSLQGFLGYLLFYNKNYFRFSALILGILTLLTSAFQKVIILTLIFGNTLWESFNLFVDFILQQFSIISNQSAINFSLIIAGIYLGIHLLAGVIIGLIAGKLPIWINDLIDKDEIKFQSLEKSDGVLSFKNQKRKKWWKKPSGIIILFLSIIFVVLSYIFPQIAPDKTTEIIIMIIRAVVIMFVWYALLSPIVLKIIQKHFKKKENQYSKQIENIIGLFPHFNSLINKSWKNSSKEKGAKKFKFFIAYVFTFLLLLNPDE